MTMTWTFVFAGALLFAALLALLNDLKATATVAGVLAILLIVDATGLPDLAYHWFGA